jgi:uncharacterized protein (DUF58 family)
MRLGPGGLGLGVVALGAAVATGSRVLGVVGVGFVLAGAVSWLWTWFADAPVVVTTSVSPTPATEGDRVRLDVALTRPSRVPLGSLAVNFELGRLGNRTCRLHGHGRSSTGSVDLGRPARGVYPITDIEVVAGDLLGLQSVTPRATTADISMVVRPRLVALDGLFTDAGRRVGDGRRLLLRRAAGFDFHSVREYEQGESLRRVHWPTSARRGQLMVKELEETAHDGVVVVLDCDSACQAGSELETSFDVAVRAAGSIVQAHAERGRVALLVSTGGERTAMPVRSAATDLDAMVTALAAAEPSARHGLARFLSADHAWTSSGEIVLVTSTTDPAAFGRILALSARRGVAVVWVDAPSFAGRPTRAEPGLLRLAAHGVTTAVLRHGDDLARVLGARAMQAAAGD